MITRSRGHPLLLPTREISRMEQYLHFFLEKKQRDVPVLATVQYSITWQVCTPLALYCSMYLLKNVTWLWQVFEEEEEEEGQESEFD